MSNIIEQVRNRQLYDECSEFVSTVFKKGEDDLREGFKLYRPRGKRDYSYIFRRLKDNIINLDIYKKCKKTMESDPIIDRHLKMLIGPYYSGSPFTVLDFLNFLLSEQLSDSKGDFKFNIENFNSHYLELENFFYNDIIEMRAIIRLHYFNSEIDILKIDECINLKKIGKRDSFWYHYENRIVRERWSEFILEYVFESEKIIGDVDIKDFIFPDESEFKSKLMKVISALRLFKEGNFIDGDFIITPKSNVMTSSTVRRGSFNPYKMQTDCYDLKTDEVEDFRSFSNDFMRTDLTKYKEFKVALRRYNIAYERHRYDDKLIDLFISLESLFFSKHETGEFIHKLSSRLSRFLKDDFEERKKLRKDIKKLYKSRSLLVHGEDKEVDEDEITRLQNYLREALLKYYENLPASHNNFIDRLDLS